MDWSGSLPDNGSEAGDMKYVSWFSTATTLHLSHLSSDSTYLLISEARAQVAHFLEFSSKTLVKIMVQKLLNMCSLTNDKEKNINRIQIIYFWMCDKEMKYAMYVE